MDFNINLEERIKKFPSELQEVAKLILDAIERGKPKSRITELIKNEIREIVIEEEEKWFWRKSK